MTHWHKTAPAQLALAIPHACAYKSWCGTATGRTETALSPGIDLWDIVGSFPSSGGPTSSCALASSCLQSAGEYHQVNTACRGLCFQDPDRNLLTSRLSALLAHRVLDMLSAMAVLSRPCHGPYSRRWDEAQAQDVPAVRAATTGIPAARSGGLSCTRDTAVGCLRWPGPHTAAAPQVFADNNMARRFQTPLLPHCVVGLL